MMLVVQYFVGVYVYDFKVGFLYNVELFSYFQLWGMVEFSCSVWQEVGDWVSDMVVVVDGVVMSVVWKVGEVVDVVQCKVVQVVEVMKFVVNDVWNVVEK